MDPSILAQQLDTLQNQTQRLRKAVVGLGAALVALVIVGATVLIAGAGTTDPLGSGTGPLAATMDAELLTQMARDGADPGSVRAERSHIHMSGNDEVDALAEREHWSGTGTEADPYVMSDYKILALEGEALRIQDTDRHIIVWENVIEGNEHATAIVIDNAPHVTLKQNTLSDAGTGIEVRQSPGVHIERNRIERAGTAIQATGSPALAIIANNLTANTVAVRLTTSDMAEAATIHNNTIDARSTGTARSMGLVLKAPATIQDNHFRLGDSLAILDHGHDTRYTRNTFTGQGSGIQIGETGSTTAAHDIVVEGNLFDALNGTHIHLVQATDITITDNVHRDLEGRGVVVHHGSGITIRGMKATTTTANAATAIIANATGHLVIEDNRIEGAARGIVLIATPGADVTRNDIKKSGILGIADLGGTNDRIVGNTLSGGELGVLIARQATGTDIIGNTIRKHTIAVGIDEFSAGTNVRSNVITEKGQQGIHIGNATGTTLTDNRIDSMVAAIYLQPVARDITIESGYTLSNTWGLFAERGASDVTINDVWIGHNSVAMWLLGAERFTVQGNIMDQNGQGLFILRGGNHTVTQNHIEDNRLGIHLVFTQGNTIYDNVIANDQLPSDRNALTEDSHGNAWFVEPRQGTSIAGGPVIAGNLWHDYVGADADRDGIGDLPYTLVPAEETAAVYEAANEDPAPQDDHPLMGHDLVAARPVDMPPQLPPLPPLPVPWPEGVPTPDELLREIPWPALP